jgi:hypothetical protein
MRFVARVLSLIFLVFAVLAGLVDAIQSVAASELVLTPLIEAWSAGSPDTLDFVEGLVAEYLPGPAWDTVLPGCSHSRPARSSWRCRCCSTWRATGAQNPRAGFQPESQGTACRRLQQAHSARICALPEPLQH